jgi:hypothetical protein
LATAAVLLAGPSAVSALKAYLRAVVQNAWGSAEFVAATLGYVGQKVTEPAITEGGSQRFAEMLNLAE